ncbi:periodic tryptophan protein 1 homolog [Haliotis rufescens]|uniref:periodic tryptophan protein 1 homolog n=1 Tax=Haliotis rufescens TaxID=6454 RepID=UPI00201E88AC|nr:periodic tryptophan protein 1 homolog [Haliotis rufescens]
MNVVPCLAWVKRGVAERNPHKVELDKQDLKKVIQATREELDELEDEYDPEDEEVQAAGGHRKIKEEVEDTSQKTKKKKKAKKRKHEEEKEDEEVEDEDIVSKYGLDDYDDEGDEDALISGVGGLSFYASNEEDPYVTVPKDVDSDEEDFEIKPMDNLVLAGRAHKDHCFLEVYVYNETLGNLFVHHDYLLSSFPLAVEWLSFSPTDSSTGNYAAVATMEPVIEIWNLDVVDCLEPAAVLGSKQVKKKKKRPGAAQSHTESVLDLSWNSVVGNVLASASADNTIALWDLAEQKVVTSIRQHTDKVQAIQWHPREAQTLLSGGFDQTARVYDCRSPEENHKTWEVQGEVEKVLWNNQSPVNFFVTTDQGIIYYMDIRHDSKPVFTLSAHSEAVTGICLSSATRGLLVTTSSDKMMKVWDMESGKPSLVLERNLKMSELYCVDSCPDAPFVFAFGGEKEMKVWDIRESATVRKHFHSRMSATLQAECKGDDKDLPDELEEDMIAMATPDMAADDEEEEMMKELGETTGGQGKKKKKKKKKKQKKGILEY